ncbi:Hypothetical predicted protein, partial [Paramuricea clavata]
LSTGMDSAVNRDICENAQCSRHLKRSPAFKLKQIHGSCASVNYKTSGIDKEFNHIAIIKQVIGCAGCDKELNLRPCDSGEFCLWKHHATIYRSDRKFCPSFFTRFFSPINKKHPEPLSRSAPPQATQKSSSRLTSCTQSIGRFNKSSNNHFGIGPLSTSQIKNCYHLSDLTRSNCTLRYRFCLLKSLSNGVYQLRNNDSLQHYKVYCHMTELSGCGQAGWTLVMKVDGSKNDFNYSSPYWTNKETYAIEDGLQGLNEKQTKLASYWNTPFNKICLGMKVNGATKWIASNYTTISLHSVIEDGTFKRTTIGKEAWKSLINGSSLQKNCNQEGFNMVTKNKFKRYAFAYTNVRIGLVANNQNDCESCNSCIGFGSSYNPTATMKACSYHKCHEWSKASVHVKDISGFYTENDIACSYGIFRWCGWCWLVEDCRETKQIFSTNILLDKNRDKIQSTEMQGVMGIVSAVFEVYIIALIQECGDRNGWTLVMKVNGTKQKTFGHNSPYWMNKESYAVEDGLEGLTEKESKLASYWNTPFKKICLGMTVDGDRKWMMLDYEANSLYSVIADGKHRKTAAGLAAWASLINKVYWWHRGCKIEGFNVKKGSLSARIGFASNEPALCDGVGSAIAFGCERRLQYRMQLPEKYKDNFDVSSEGPSSELTGNSPSQISPCGSHFERIFQKISTYMEISQQDWNCKQKYMQRIIGRRSELNTSSIYEMQLFVRNLKNGIYYLQAKASSQKYPVYCHMTAIPGCGKGGWTLVMKTDGDKQTFGYDSPYWTNKEGYAVEDGLEGLTEKESKLASYWNTPFKKICLGMTVNGDRKWMVLDNEASSLYSLMEDGKYRFTSAGRDAWKSLIAGSSLQPNCNKEGFANRSIFVRLHFCLLMFFNFQTFGHAIDFCYDGSKEDSKGHSFSHHLLDYGFWCHLLHIVIQKHDFSYARQQNSLGIFKANACMRFPCFYRTSCNFEKTCNNSRFCEFYIRNFGETRRSSSPIFKSSKTCADNNDWNCDDEVKGPSIINMQTNLKDGIYYLQAKASSQKYPVYCQMTGIPGCGGGGWTLVMKTDGYEQTFGYSSTLWTNKESYAVEDGLEGLPEKESKLASYWNTPFKKVCLGMTVNGDRKWMMLDYEASSLHSVIADGKYRSTSAGRPA